MIEVISPANKSGEGRKGYLRKQKDLLNSQVNLVEIDLLGFGQTTTLARTANITSPAEWRYVITISRTNYRRSLEAYAFGIKDRLPRSRIPLHAADPDVVLDLPTVFNRCYDVGGYDLLIDYTQEPPVVLAPDGATWVHTYLQAQGFGPQ